MAGIGAGFFSPKDSTLEDETKFSAQVGAGTNYRFTDNLLLRLDVRWLATFFDSNGAVMIKMTTSTSITSTSGVILISLMGWGAAVRSRRPNVMPPRSTAARVAAPQGG